MNVHDPPNPATASAIRSPTVDFLLDHLVGIARRASAHQLLRRVELTPQHAQHVHPGVRLLPQQHHDVVSVDLDADRLLDRDRIGLVRRLLEHGGKAKELAVRRLRDDDVLMVLVDGRDPDGAGDHDVGPFGRVADLVDALARGESSAISTWPASTADLVVVQQGKEGDLSENCRVARHRSPRRTSILAEDRFRSAAWSSGEERLHLVVPRGPKWGFRAEGIDAS